MLYTGRTQKRALANLDSDENSNTHSDDRLVDHEGWGEQVPAERNTARYILPSLRCWGVSACWEAPSECSFHVEHCFLKDDMQRIGCFHREVRSRNALYDEDSCELGTGIARSPAAILFPETAGAYEALDGCQPPEHRTDNAQVPNTARLPFDLPGKALASSSEASGGTGASSSTFARLPLFSASLRRAVDCAACCVPFAWPIEIPASQDCVRGHTRVFSFQHIHSHLETGASESRQQSVSICGNRVRTTAGSLNDGQTTTIDVSLVKRGAALENRSVFLTMPIVPAERVGGYVQHIRCDIDTVDRAACSNNSNGNPLLHSDQVAPVMVDDFNDAATQELTGDGDFKADTVELVSGDPGSNADGAACAASSAGGGRDVAGDNQSHAGDVNSADRWLHGIAPWGGLDKLYDGGAHCLFPWTRTCADIATIEKHLDATGLHEGLALTVCGHWRIMEVYREHNTEELQLHMADDAVVSTTAQRYLTTDRCAAAAALALMHDDSSDHVGHTLYGGCTAVSHLMPMSARSAIVALHADPMRGPPTVVVNSHVMHRCTASAQALTEGQTAVNTQTIVGVEGESGDVRDVRCELGAEVATRTTVDRGRELDPRFNGTPHDVDLRLSTVADYNVKTSDAAWLAAAIRPTEAPSEATEQQHGIRSFRVGLSVLRQHLTALAPTVQMVACPPLQAENHVEESSRDTSEDTRLSQGGNRPLWVSPTSASPYPTGVSVSTQAVVSSAQPAASGAAITPRRPCNAGVAIQAAAAAAQPQFQYSLPEDLVQAHEYIACAPLSTMHGLVVGEHDAAASMLPRTNLARRAAVDSDVGVSDEVSQAEIPPIAVDHVVHAAMQLDSLTPLPARRPCGPAQAVAGAAASVTAEADATPSLLRGGVIAPLKCVIDGASGEGATDGLIAKRLRTDADWYKPVKRQRKILSIGWGDGVKRGQGVWQQSNVGMPERSRKGAPGTRDNIADAMDVPSLWLNAQVECVSSTSLPPRHHSGFDLPPTRQSLEQPPQPPQLLPDLQHLLPQLQLPLMQLRHQYQQPSQVQLSPRPPESLLSLQHKGQRVQFDETTVNHAATSGGRVLRRREFAHGPGKRSRSAATRNWSIHGTFDACHAIGLDTGRTAETRTEHGASADRSTSRQAADALIGLRRQCGTGSNERVVRTSARRQVTVVRAQPSVVTGLDDGRQSAAALQGTTRARNLVAVATSHVATRARIRVQGGLSTRRNYCASNTSGGDT